MTFDPTEPCFGEGLALERPAEPEQEALQGRDVSADGAGPAAAAAGKRAAPDGSAPRQGRPPPVPGNGDSCLKDVKLALRFPSDWTWNLFSHPQVRQLDAAVLSLKQQKQQSQSSAAKALELENAALKRELEAQKERSSVRRVHTECAAFELSPHCLPVLPEVRRRTRTGAAGEPPARERSAEDADVPTVLAAHGRRDISPSEHVDVNYVPKRDKLMFFQTLQAQLVGFLPPSPHRIPRVQNRGDDEENAQVRKRSRWFCSHSPGSFSSSVSLVWWPLKSASFNFNSFCLGFISAVCPCLVLFCLHCRVGCLARGTSVFLNLKVLSRCCWRSSHKLVVLLVSLLSCISSCSAA